MNGPAINISDRVGECHNKLFNPMGLIKSAELLVTQTEQYDLGPAQSVENIVECSLNAAYDLLADILNELEDIAHEASREQKRGSSNQEGQP